VKAVLAALAALVFLLAAERQARGHDLVLIELAAEVGRVANRRVVPLPAIAVVEAGEIARRCGCNARALFVEGVVWLSPSVDLATGEGQAILVHELVHGAQQAERGPAGDCADWLDREAEAVRVERLWRVQHGLRLPPAPRYACTHWR